MNALVNFLTTSYSVPHRILDKIKATYPTEQGVSNAALRACAVGYRYLTTGEKQPPEGTVDAAYVNEHINGILAAALIRHTHAGSADELTALARYLTEAYHIPMDVTATLLEEFSEIELRNTATIDLIYSIFLSSVTGSLVTDTSVYWGNRDYYDAFLATAVCRKYHKELSGIAVATNGALDETAIIMPVRGRL
jgi:hypothetical protein